MLHHGLGAHLPPLRRCPVCKNPDWFGEDGIGISARLSRGRTSGLPGRGGPYLTPNARFDKLLHLPEGVNAGKTINEALRGIEADFGPENADTFLNFALVC